MVVEEPHPGTGGVFLGSEADESGTKPGLVRGWRFTWGDDAFPPKWRSERWRGVWIRRYAFPNERQLRPGPDDDDWGEPLPELHAGPGQRRDRPNSCPER